MQIAGKIIYVSPEHSGTSARGEWMYQEFVIETLEAYPKNIALQVWGRERVQRCNLQVGEVVSVAFDIDAKEYNGKWYNNVRAYDVRPNVTTAPDTQHTASEDIPF